MEEHTEAHAGKRTPLPLIQLCILLFLRFCESASTAVIYPFLHDLLVWITGEEERVGYYAGAMEFIRQAVSLAVVMFWSRVSDHIGRKPILFMGTLALAISTTFIGLSKTFWVLVLSRCIFTGLNSNAGVIKGMIGEITDETNKADAFALLHIPWAIGYSFGALVGGSLVASRDRSSPIPPNKILEAFPYLLPCLSMGLLSVVGCILVSLFLRETVHGARPFRRPHRRGVQELNEEEADPLLHPVSESLTPVRIEQDVKPPPLRTILTRPVIVACVNYCVIGALHVSFNTLNPLFLAAPVDLGGLALRPRSIGYIISAYGLCNALGQAFILGRVVRTFGAKKVFTSALLGCMPLYLLPIAMSVWVRSFGLTWPAKVMLLVDMICLFIVELGYGSIYIFINASAPNNRALGAVNGVGQTMVSVGRIVMPALANTIWSLSIEYGETLAVLGHGYLAWFIMPGLAIGGLYIARSLPSLPVRPSR